MGLAASRARVLTDWELWAVVVETVRQHREAAGAFTTARVAALRLADERGAAVWEAIASRIVDMAAQSAPGTVQ